MWGRNSFNPRFPKHSCLQTSLFQQYIPLIYLQLFLAANFDKSLFWLIIPTQYHSSSFISTWGDRFCKFPMQKERVWNTNFGLSKSSSIIVISNNYDAIVSSLLIFRLIVKTSLNGRILLSLFCLEMLLWCQIFSIFSIFIIFNFAECDSNQHFWDTSSYPHISFNFAWLERTMLLWLSIYWGSRFWRITSK